MGLFVKKNDTVIIISGKDKGKKGKVLRVLEKKEKVIVERVNMIKKHTRPNPAKQVKGGVVEKEAPISVSKIMVVCPECGVPTRVGKKILPDGGKQRICKKCNGVIG
ncbi:MAG: 50S ribosomal protein L24 [Thermoanaerobaculia bacterium]